MALVALTGCFSPSYHSGGLQCGQGRQPCPDGYHCAVDGYCWKNGDDPDPASGSDLSPADLARADLAAPGDLGTTDLLPPDLASADGSHRVKAITAACGGGVKAAGSRHSITWSVGQKTSGAAAGTAHKLQLGVLYGTQAK